MSSDGPTSVVVAKEGAAAATLIAVLASSLFALHRLATVINKKSQTLATVVIRTPIQEILLSEDVGNEKCPIYLECILSG